ncbi:MAG: hypothetical protein V2I43_19005 [Parvularcula sp.]|jgi:hypothetical protein|nr:hypothetical protein [Parvularcula sp.]
MASGPASYEAQVLLRCALAVAFGLLVSCGIDRDRVYEAGDEVRFNNSGPSSSSDDIETIVVTALYPYDLDAKHSRPEDRFRVTGPPLSFAFPKAAYGNSENREGGPQGSIYLDLDRVSLKPYSQLLLENGINKNHRTRRNTAPFRKRRFSVDIASNYLDRSVEFSSQNWLLGTDPSTSFQVCGFTFAKVDRDFSLYDDQEKPKIGDVTVDFAPYKGVSIEGSGQPRLARCGLGSPICVVSFDYSGRHTSFGLPREDFCEETEYVERLTEFLKKHEIKRPQQRFSSKTAR